MTQYKNILNKWIARGEDTQIDFKHAITSSPKIAKSLSAFANTRGGKIVVGVDDNGDIVGCDPDAEKYQLNVAAEKYIAQDIEQEFDILDHLGARILISTISESSKKPIYAIDKKGKEKLYVRLLDKCVIPPESLKVMLIDGEFNNALLTHSYRNEQIVLQKYLIKQTSISIPEYAELKGISTDNAKRILYHMLLDGHIKLKQNKEDIFELA